MSCPPLPSFWPIGSGLALALAAFACAGTEKQAADPLPPPDAARKEDLKKAERLFVAREPGWPSARDPLIADASTRPWLVRMLVHYALESYRKEGFAGEDEARELVPLGRQTWFTR